MLKLLFGPIIPKMIEKGIKSEISGISPLVDPLLINPGGLKRVFNSEDIKLKLLHLSNIFQLEKAIIIESKKIFDSFSEQASMIIDDGFKS